MMATTPSLPTELERAIFELAANTSPSTIPTLLRVAQRVRIWLEPLLYRVLVFDNFKSGLNLREAIEAKSAHFLSAVRHVNFVQGVITTSDAKSILESCPGIVNLGLPWDVADPSLLPLLGTMCLQRLSANLLELFGQHSAGDLKHPLFRSVTHIGLIDGIEAGDVVWMKRLSTLPALRTWCSLTRTKRIYQS
ncbi:hypothetical protein B0H17DRAFT_317412 [Mycena rosella]|uniref:Uncharacterized protein n=1 Tax=Mycena rosella TaxID=1033263 RepID=A0AAD7DU44_MYCRO|nr:hypothetical protein B0H17DRAFT_317412 [Mycena rosella]